MDGGVVQKTNLIAWCVALRRALALAALLAAGAGHAAAETGATALDAAVAAEPDAEMADARRRVAADDRQDFADARRGFIASRTDSVIRNAAGEPLIDLAAYDFLRAAAPSTVNPSLWRQAQILTMHGLFEVDKGIYQVRGFDVSTVTFIDAGPGWIVVDPLTSVEAARAAFELLTQHLGSKPVLAVIYSHSHADHYGGVLGVTTRAAVAAGTVQIIAPDGFLEHAVSENIIAGPAMSRRARFQFGMTLPRGPTGEITSGLGPKVSRGTTSLIAPTHVIKHTGERLRVGDLDLVFQVTPGTEAPAEMNFYLPQKHALFMAENANLTMHNLLPARGALVRDAKAWADYLTESLRLYGRDSQVLFAAHGIPRFGQPQILQFLRLQRDAYKFLHDQSVRLMNNGATGSEIAELLRLPEALASQWFNRGYYGTMSHNSKAVYQRYMGWYDANPAHLNALPPEAAAQKYVAAMGGANAVLQQAQSAVAAGEYRWAAMLLDHLVFAGGDNRAARELLASVYTRLGYQSEAGTWRNIYLTGAQELLQSAAPAGAPSTGAATFSIDVLAATPTTMLLDFAAVRLNPTRALAKSFSIRIDLSDLEESHFLRVENGVLIHESNVDDPADGTARMTRPTLLMTLFAGVPVQQLIDQGDIVLGGDKTLYAGLVGLIDAIDPNFAIVTP